MVVSGRCIAAKGTHAWLAVAKLTQISCFESETRHFKIHGCTRGSAESPFWNGSLETEKLSFEEVFNHKQSTFAKLTSQQHCPMQIWHLRSLKIITKLMAQAVASEEEETSRTWGRKVSLIASSYAAKNKQTNVGTHQHFQKVSRWSFSAGNLLHNQKQL